MRTRPFPSFLCLAIIALLVAGCDDSTRPLSDPQNAKPDARLAGVWRVRESSGNLTYYHVGPAGGNLPDGVMRVVSVTHADEGLRQSAPLLIIPATLSSGSYLSVTFELIPTKGWEGIESYYLLKYKLEGDTLLVWQVDGDAEKKAIESKKVKGRIEQQDSGERVRFADTTENLAKFVAAAGDSLFVKDPLKLERVK